MSGRQSIFIGDRFELNNGGYAIVDNYKNAKEISVITNTGFETVVQGGDIRKGILRDQLIRTVRDVGYLGIGKFNRYSESYKTWSNIHTRCYYEKYLLKQLTYINCIVADVWHNYQNFKTWHKENYIENWQLDKDLIFPGNVIYSPDKSMYVPREINSFFHSRKNETGLPLGVRKGYSRFRNSINTITFETIKEACDDYWRLKLEKLNILIIKYPEFEEILVNYYDYFYDRNYMNATN